MELSVEEIIARVAIQRQRQKQAQKQQQLLKQINNKSHDLKHSRINQSKNAIKLNLLNQNNAHNQTLSKKYHQLHTLYKKLKTQVFTELKMDKKYSQMMQKLTIVIQQNSKFQTELDGLRMKRSIIEENERSLWEENVKRNNNNSKRWMADCVEKSGRGRKSANSIVKYPLCCQCAERKPKQNCTEAYQGERSSKKNIKKNKINKTQQAKQFNIRTSHSPNTHDLTTQIQRYKSMIQQKQSSINKLKPILQKQEQIIQSYKSIQPKVGQIKSKMKKMKPSSENERKIQGTIVKVKREKHGVNAYLANKAVTDRDILPQSNYHFLSPPYIQPNNQKTKKKPEFINHLGAIKQIQSPAQPHIINHPYSYINSYPSQQQQQSHPHYYYKPQFHSPSSSINQTSEFVCGELE